MSYIYIPNVSRQSIGGGWTFLRNIRKYFGGRIVETATEADTILICGATMIDVSELEQWKAQGKKIIFRVDNVTKNSRNGGRGIGKMLQCAEYADVIIYQSHWSKMYAGTLLGRDGEVIYNGADTDIFYPPENRRPEMPYRYLFIKDKNSAEAFYHFYNKSKEWEECVLSIIGRFPQELIENNFDFWNGEKVNYYGVIDRPQEMADIMRKNDVLLFPAFADSCPQTVVEALNCGLEIEMVNDVGGTRELLMQPLEHLSLEYMGEQYDKVIQSVTK